jgi:hypothetical protein
MNPPNHNQIVTAINKIFTYKSGWDRWVVYWYLINSKPTDEKARIKIFRCFQHFEEAKEFADKMIRDTGIDNIMIGKTSEYISVTTAPKPNDVGRVVVDMPAEAVKAAEEKYRQDQLEYEQLMKSQELRTKEQEATLASGSLDNHVYNWVCYLQNKQHEASLEEQLAAIRDKIKQRKDAILEHPEHNGNWQEALQKKTGHEWHMFKDAIAKFPL